MSWAWTQPIKPGLKIVLLALADHSDCDGICWPGVAGVAKKCGLSRRQVMRSTSELAKLGMLRVVRKSENGADKRSNSYILNILGDTMSPNIGDTMSPKLDGKVTSEAKIGDICDSAYKEEPSVEPSITPLIPPRKKSKSNKSQHVFVLPDWVDKDAWSAFEDMRKVIRKPMTDYARSLLIDKLSDLMAKGQSPVDVLNQSTLHSWQGIFPVKNNETNCRIYETTTQKRERIAEAIDNATRDAIAGCLD